MNRLLQVVLLAALPVAMSAVSEEESAIGTCAFLSELAEMVMEARQAGIPLGELLDATEQFTAERIPEFDDQGTEIIKGLALMAYSKQRGVGEWSQQRAVEEFRDGVMMECLAAFEG